MTFKWDLYHREDKKGKRWAWHIDIPKGKRILRIIKTLHVDNDKAAPAVTIRSGYSHGKSRRSNSVEQSNVSK